MRFFCLSNPPLPVELLRAEEKEEPKFRTTLRVLGIFHSPFSSVLKTQPEPSVMPPCASARPGIVYQLLSFKFTFRFVRAELTPTTHLSGLGAGRGAAAQSTHLISTTVTLLIVTSLILLEEICCFQHWEQQGKSQRTGSKRAQISTAILLSCPFPGQLHF